MSIISFSSSHLIEVFENIIFEDDGVSDDVIEVEDDICWS